VLRVFKINLLPLVFISPRGLVTILLYLSIPASMTISIVNDSLIIQVIILTSLALMLGMLTSKPKQVKTKEKVDKGKVDGTNEGPALEGLAN